jgi:transporter family protein
MTLAPWVLPALGAAFAIAVHYLLLRAASGKIGDRLGALILEAVAAVGIAVAYLFLPRGAAVATTRAGVIYAALSGIGISFASILLFAALRRGGTSAQTATVVLGGGVALSALAAPIFFDEPFTVRRLVGVGLGLAAIAVLSTEAASP